MTQPTYLKSDNPRVPEARCPFRHCVDVQTRFSDIDMLGHINNNTYLTFMDLGKIQYFSDINGGKMNVADVRAVVVHVSCDFYEPAFFQEPLQVWSTITHVGTRSFTIEQRVINALTLSTKCIGTTVLAGFDPETQTGAPLDEQWIASAAAYEKRDLVSVDRQ